MEQLKKLKWPGIIAFILLICYGLYSAWSYGIRLGEQDTVQFDNTLWEQVSFLDESKPEDMIFPVVNLQVNNRASLLEADFGYPGMTYLWDRQDQTVQWSFNVDRTDDYLLVIDYLPLISQYEEILLDVEVDGNIIPNGENVRLPVMFVYEQSEFKKNAKGNHIFPNQTFKDIFMSHTLKNGKNSVISGKLVLHLEEGRHTIRLIKKEGALQLGNIRLTKHVPPVSYDTYLSRIGNKGNPPDKTLILLEAEQFYYKNENDISITSKNNYLVSPYSTGKALLNTINEHTFKHSGQRLAYLVSIEQEGFYYIGVKSLMPAKPNSLVFMDIEIDREIPFIEFSSVAIDYKRSVGNHLSDYPVYLDKGVHEIALTLNGNNYNKIADKLEAVSNEINDLSMDIVRLTGNNQDKKREWDLKESLPDMVDDMNRWNQILKTSLDELTNINRGKLTEESQNLRIAIKQLERLIKEPNRVPSRLAILSQGSSSVLQMLSKALLIIKEQKIALDQIILTTDPNLLPVDKPHFIYSAVESLNRFIASFRQTGGPVNENESKTIDVWVKNSRQYLDVIQTLVDESFTVKTGIEVRLSLMNDQSKLTLANAAGKQPDGVLGVDSFYINDLATRGSLTDLKQFDGINYVLSNIAPGSLIQMIIDDKLYGLPQTQDFYVLFYRKDIFKSFGFKVPQTWEDVLLLMPSLHRNGMSFFTSLSGESSFKVWPSTFPFYAQFGADIYAMDGSKTVVDSELGIQAMKFMTDLFKIYGMPLQVKSFYNNFRFGETPIGIGNFSTYVELKKGAPELDNQWGLALMPGMPDSEGVIQRWCTGGSQAVAIFEASDKKEATWDFMEWWLSEETQTNYTIRLKSTYGDEYLWNSSNLKALSNMPIPQGDRDVILEQVKWVKEAPKIPGGYFTEREISNAWNKIVFDGVDVRTAVEDAVITTNREILRKLEEFGYVKDGKMIREYIVPTIEEVEGWLENEAR